jgi:hypothetical protein
MFSVRLQPKNKRQPLYRPTSRRKAPNRGISLKYVDIYFRFFLPTDAFPLTVSEQRLPCGLRPAPTSKAPEPRGFFYCGVDMLSLEHAPPDSLAVGASPAN